MISENARTIATFRWLQAVVIRQLNVSVIKVNPCTRFREDLGADALDLVELVNAIAEEFGSAVFDEGFQDVQTLGELAVYIERVRNPMNELVYT